MRNFKRNLGLSVLAIACLGASAFGVQSALAASAEGTVKIAEGLTMEHGASVSLNEEFSGIRWKTNVVGGKCDTADEIGVLVAPNVAAADLTKDTAKVMKLPVKEGTLDLTQDQTFYSVIDYNEIAQNYTGTLTEEEALKKAYALELTARPYVIVNGEYQYADMTGINTARSARQVAIAAELAGEIDEKYRNVPEKEYLADNAEKYYGMTDKYEPAVKSTGAIDSAVINLETIKTADRTIKIDLEITGNVDEVLVGAEKVLGKVAYADGKLGFVIKAGQIMPTGENYITVFTEEGGLYTAPVIGATKVFTDASELAMFQTKGGRYQWSTKKAGWVDGKADESQIYSGYYVLGKTLDASAYIHGSRNSTTELVTEDMSTTHAGKTFAEAYGEFNNATWNGAAALKGYDFGLTGTFNGMGYSIDGMTIATQNEGLFGIVNGGTVKNVALTDVKSQGQNYAYVLANYLQEATIENIHISTVKADADTGVAFAFTEGSAILAANAYADTQISNCIIRANKQNTATKGAALFGVRHSGQSYDCKNVFVYSRSHYQYHLATTTTDETTSETTTTYKMATVNYYLPLLFVQHATRAKDANGAYTVITEKGEIYLAENQVEDPDAEVLVPNAYATGEGLTADAYDIKVIKGVYLYRQGEESLEPNPWESHDFSSFLASGCWQESTAGRGVAWITK